MDTILKQLGGLVLGSVPTMILFLLLILAYNLLVRRPLLDVLGERRSRTLGAVEQARGAIAAAEAETTVYEDKLRSAKVALFHAREDRLKQWNAERDTVLADVRHTAGEHVKAARTEIEASAAASRSQIEGLSSELSARVIAAVLPKGIVAPEVVQ